MLSIFMSPPNVGTVVTVGVLDTTADVALVDVAALELLLVGLVDSSVVVACII